MKMKKEIIMKLMALPKEFFQIEEKVDFNVDLLYSKYGHIEIFDLLKQNISNIGIILSEIKVNPKSDRYSHEFNAFCKADMYNSTCAELIEVDEEFIPFFHVVPDLNSRTINEKGFFGVSFTTSTRSITPLN